MTIPDHIKDKINEIIEIVDGETNDWIIIRRQIINAIYPFKDRSYFSRRHYSTKKIIINDFEKKVINYWEQQTGQKVHIDESKLHPSDWVRRPHGWALMKKYGRRHEFLRNP